jgi:hypothetical protein
VILIVIVIVSYFRGLGNYRFVFVDRIFVEFLTRGYI